MNTKVRSYLIELARKRTNQVVGYQKLCDDCQLSLKMQDSRHDRDVIGEILGDISAYEFDNGRPLLSALVIRLSDGVEGDGFYKMAEDLGVQKNKSWQALKRDRFDVLEINACLAFWSDKNKYNLYKDI